MSDTIKDRYTAINSREHDSDEPKAKRVLMYGWDADSLTKVRIKVNADGSLAAGSLDLNWAEKSGDSDIIYVGDAATGTATNAASWRIFEVTVSTGALRYADGDGNFDNIWDNRESLSY